MHWNMIPGNVWEPEVAAFEVTRSEALDAVQFCIAL